MKIVLRSVNDDWTELLINGELMLEGHTLPESEIIKAVMPKDAEFAQEHINRCMYCDIVLSENSRTYKCEPQCAHD